MRSNLSRNTICETKVLSASVKAIRKRYVHALYLRDCSISHILRNWVFIFGHDASSKLLFVEISNCGAASSLQGSADEVWLKDVEV